MRLGKVTMADKPDDDAAPTPTAPLNDRRQQGDRRKAQLPFDGPDRRKGDRRSGTDRRKTPRASGDDHEGEG
jgi:hypothetical protein